MIRVELCLVSFAFSPDQCVVRLKVNGRSGSDRCESRSRRCVNRRDSQRYPPCWKWIPPRTTPEQIDCGTTSSTSSTRQYSWTCSSFQFRFKAVHMMDDHIMSRQMNPAPMTQLRRKSHLGESPCLPPRRMDLNNVLSNMFCFSDSR